MTHQWVVRKKLTTMELTENQAHLVMNSGVLRAAPALCGVRVKEEEFWESANKKIPACRECRSHLKKR